MTLSTDDKVYLSNLFKDNDVSLEQTMYLLSSRGSQASSEEVLEFGAYVDTQTQLKSQGQYYDREIDVTDADISLSLAEDLFRLNHQPQEPTYLEQVEAECSQLEARGGDGLAFMHNAQLQEALRMGDMVQAESIAMEATNDGYEVNIYSDAQGNPTFTQVK